MIIDINKVLMGVIVSLLGWQLLQTFNLSKEVAILNIKMETALQESFDSRDGELLATKINRLEQWNQNLSNRLAKLEETTRVPR